jgi:hypothetical protein
MAIKGTEPYCPVCNEHHYGICPKAPHRLVPEEFLTSLKERVMPPSPKFLQFVADQEPWTQYTLENGAVIRIRVMLVKVINEGKINPDGSPQYQLQCQQVMDITWPEDIQRDIAKRQAGGQE